VAHHYELMALMNARTHCMHGRIVARENDVNCFRSRDRLVSRLRRRMNGVLAILTVNVVAPRHQEKTAQAGTNNQLLK